MNSRCYDNRGYWSGMHASHAGSLSAVGYSALGEGFNRASYRLRRNAVLRLLRRAQGMRGARLLEAAVGVGAYGPVWRRLGVSRWVGLDIAEDAIAYCRKTYPEGEFLVQDLAEQQGPITAAPAEKFDLVTAIDVLYHLVDDTAFEAALRNLAACVRPGGALLVSDVFVSETRRIAPHVTRRPIADYQRVLGDHMMLADRETVFAILADPAPRPEGPFADRMSSLAWRVLCRAVMTAPEAIRGVVGESAVMAAWPLDALLRRLGWGRGVNLELALFRDTRCAA